MNKQTGKDSNDPKDEKFFKDWMTEIADALKREKSYRQKAGHCVDLYEAKTPETVPFSILYSNTETLIPALYNNRPIPVVMRRFRDPDPVGKAVADTSTRLLKYLIDTDTEEYDTYDELTALAVTESVVTNRGLCRFKYLEEGPSECVHGESVRWDKFLHGYARTWKKVPWAGFEWDMSEEEVRKNFPDIPFDKKAYENQADDGDSTGKESREELTGVKTYKVYEIWDKASRKVFFLSYCYPKGPMRLVDDPLGLKGFFPIPKPLNFLQKITTLVPTPLYEHYKSQAAELNDITRRLKNIIKAVRYRGIYNSTIDEIKQVLEGEENELIPATGMESLPDNSGLDKMIWTVPVAELAATAQQLYAQREQIKQTIYEITGLSDILRGSSVASETATAQDIKVQWGTQRLKKMQKEVQRYCRESLQIILEIAAARFSLETIRRMTGLPYLTEEEKEVVLAKKRENEIQAELAGAQPVPVPPELEALLQGPSWEDILSVLRDDIVRTYKIDIETNSTIDAEATQDKQDISELMNALSQFLNGIGPLIQEGVLPFELAKSMLLMISRRYNFGTNIEEVLEGMQAPQKSEGPNPEDQIKIAQIEAKAKADQQSMQQKIEFEQLQHKNEMELEQLRFKNAVLEEQIKERDLERQFKASSLKNAEQEEMHRRKMKELESKREEKEVASV